MPKRRTTVKRRDATGHLDPKYAADLRLRSLEHAPREEEDVAFLDRAKSAEPLAEVLGEEFVEAATTGEDVRLEALNQGLPEDEGGPFVVTRGRDEFARGNDPSNPKDATREPFPIVLGEDAAGRDEREGDDREGNEEDERGAGVRLR